MLVIDRFDKLETAAAEITRAGNCSVFCYRDIAVPDYGNLEIYPKGVSKAATAQLIIDRINPWEVVAFGDNLNDLPLFNLADRRYAPANASDGYHSRQRPRRSSSIPLRRFSINRPLFINKI